MTAKMDRNRRKKLRRKRKNKKLKAFLIRKHRGVAGVNRRKAKRADRLSAGVRV